MTRGHGRASSSGSSPTLLALTGLQCERTARQTSYTTGKQMWLPASHLNLFLNVCVCVYVYLETDSPDNAQTTEVRTDLFIRIDILLLLHLSSPSSRESVV